MQIANSFHVPLPAEQAWAVLLNVPRIAPCMPGARLHSTDADSDTYAGEVQVRLGPVLLVFRGRAILKEVVPADHRGLVRAEEDGRAHVWNPVPNAPLVSRHML